MSDYLNKYVWECCQLEKLPPCSYCKNIVMGQCVVCTRVVAVRIRDFDGYGWPTFKLPEGEDYDHWRYLEKRQKALFPDKVKVFRSLDSTISTSFNETARPPGNWTPPTPTKEEAQKRVLQMTHGKDWEEVYNFLKEAEKTYDG